MNPGPRLVKPEVENEGGGSCYRAGALLSGIRLRLALGAVALASGPLALFAWNNGMGKGGFSSPVGGEKWFAPRPGFFEAKGVRDPELSPTGTIFNWTEREATLRFPRLERSRPATVTLRIQGTSPAAGRAPEVVLSVDGVETQRIAIPTVPRRLPLDVPARTSRGAVVSIKVDGRDGVMVENVRLLPTGGSTIPIPAEAVGALAFVALASYLAMWIAAASPATALAGTLVQAALLSWLSITGGAFLGHYSERLAWIGGLFLILALVTLRIRDLRWRRSWIAVLWLAALKFSILAHPQIVDADAAGHAANLRRVMSGDWFFTSATPPPAIAFPYPPGLYAAALPLSALAQEQWVTLLRGIAVATETLAAVAFAMAIAAMSTEAVGAVTFLLLALSPEGFAVLFIGNLSNLFSDALMVFGCSFLILGRPILASLSLLGGFLSHFGTLLLGAPLSLLLGLTRADPLSPPRRRLAPVLAALLVSFLVYYRRFVGVGVEAWDRMTTLKGAAGAGPMTAPLSEKLTRMGGGESWWITLVVAAAVVVGIATWPKDRRPLSRILVVWLLVVAAFALLGLVSPLQVRSALSARPALAALGASGLVALWAKGGPARGLAAVIVALTAVGGWMIAVSFLPVKPA